MLDNRLVVIQTHPVQYHAPVFRLLQSRFNIPTTVFYGSDRGAVDYYDRGFGVTVRWDTVALQKRDS